MRASRLTQQPPQQRPTAAVAADPVLQSVNQAAAALIRGTSAQPAVTAATAAVTTTTSGKKRNSKTPISNGAPKTKRKIAGATRAATDKREAFVAMEDHMRRDDQLALFTGGMEADNRNVHDALLLEEPPLIDPAQVLAYCAKLKLEMPWYVSMQNFVAGSDGTYEFPDTPVLSRQVILQFLREPAPLSGEQPCMNLDREPHDPAEQGLVRCIGHRMSETQLGVGKGFRLRELILPRSNTAICYLCHLWIGLCEAMRQRDKTAERARPDMTDPPATKVTLINSFMVMVGQLGEYDPEKMLTSDKVGLGIWGPFPLFNENNYIAVARKPDAPAHFDETPNLLFRLTPALSQRTESSSQSTLNPSGRIAGPPLSGTVFP